MASQRPEIPPDCHLKPGLFPGLQIQLDVGHDFSNPLTIDQTSKPAGNLTKTFSFLMRGRNGELTIRENYGGDEYQVYARLSRDSFTVTQFNNRIGGAESDTYTIHLTLKAGRKIELGTEGKNKPRPNNKYSDIQFDQIISSNTVLGINQGRVPLVRHVRVLVPNYKVVKLPAAFNEDIARKILNQELLSGFELQPEHFINLHKRAVASESDLATERQKKLKRENVRINFERLPGYANRIYIQLHQQQTDPTWLLQGQERIILYHALESDAPGIFGMTPTTTPGKRHKVWGGTVFFRHGNPCASINNVITLEVKNSMDSNREINGVTVSVEEEDDPYTTRANTALSHLKEVLTAHIEPQTHVNTDRMLQYRIPPTGIFLSKRRELISRNIAAIHVVNGDQYLDLPEYQLTQAHKTAIRNALTSICGISLIQGPPATGKTELVSKLVGWTMKHSSLQPNESIIVTAYTNVAVKVACQRYIKHCLTIFRFDFRESVCLVWTENKAEYARLVQQDLPADMAPITLDAHCDRIAATNPQRFQDYKIGRDDIRRNGRIEDKGVRRRYVANMRDLIDEVKKTVRVWFCTLATFHDRSPVFGEEQGSGIDCALLVIDEASQAHSLAAWLPWRIVNPKRIVLAGDHNQLAPFTQTTEAEWAWKQSLFEQLRTDASANVPYVLLDEQYRTTKNIYAGTNTFYDGKVRSHGTTTNRALYNKLMSSIPRIHFVDFNKTKHKITSNTHWFDLQNGQTITKGETSSSANPMELAFLCGLFQALLTCGLTAEECMLLTGYQAQYDDLVQAEESFLKPGVAVKKVDSAQGDEAGIVGISLVRTASAGLGFMAQLRRQNVMTSRARDALYAVGSVSAIDKANHQGSSAWYNWFQNMLKENGSGFHIRFNGPVTFFVDNKEIKPHLRPPPGDGQSVSPSTFVGAEEAVEEVLRSEPGSPSSRASTPRTPTGVQQGGPSSPLQRLSSSPPQVGRSSPGRSASESFGAQLERPRQSSGSFPRQPSLLNPEHGRSMSLTGKGSPQSQVGQSQGQERTVSTGGLGQQQSLLSSGVPQDRMRQGQGSQSQGGQSQGGQSQGQGQQRTVSAGGLGLQQSLPSRAASQGQARPGQLATTTGGQQQSRPSGPPRNRSMQFFTNPKIEQDISVIGAKGMAELKSSIATNMASNKAELTDRNNWKPFMELTNKLVQARQRNDPAAFDAAIQGASAAPQDAVNNACALAYAIYRLQSLGGTAVEWP